MTPSLPNALTGHAGYLAVRLGQRAQGLFEQAITVLDLRPHQYDYLVAVLEQGPLSQRELANILAIDAARIVATTDELEERGTVSRTVDPSDRRRNLITLTPRGRTLVARAGKIAGRVELELLADLGPEQQSQLRDLMRRALGYDGQPI